MVMICFYVTLATLFIKKTKVKNVLGIVCISIISVSILLQIISILLLYKPFDRSIIGGILTVLYFGDNANPLTWVFKPLYTYLAKQLYKNLDIRYLYSSYMLPDLLQILLIFFALKITILFQKNDSGKLKIAFLKKPSKNPKKKETENETEAHSKDDGLTIPEEYKPISMWGYFGYQILFSLPVIGQIILIVYAITAKNKNVKNFARSYFCFLIVFALVSIILFGLLRESLFYWF